MSRGITAMYEIEVAREIMDGGLCLEEYIVL